MLDLNKTRSEIDVIDKNIVELLEKRMELTHEVAAYKIQTGKKVFDREREESKLDTLSAMAEDAFNKQGIRELFKQIMSISRKKQYGLIDNYKEENSFERVEQINIANKKVVCFGEKGSYTEQAMEEYFGEKIERVHKLTFKEVMEALKQGEAEYGVLPIENSSTGGIVDIYDLLVKYDHYIIGEHVVKVEQALLGLPGAKVEDIKIVYSHPQGLLQCSDFLEQHCYMKKKEYESTASSAKKVLEDRDFTQGAIASKRAAKCYGLEVLQENINQVKNNSTRFIIITNQKMYLKEADKVSICIGLPHEKGSLYNILSHFIFNNLNLTKVESRPIQGKSWEYLFFIEFEGNLNEAGVKNAIHGIREEADSLRIFGNF